MYGYNGKNFVIKYEIIIGKLFFSFIILFSVKLNLVKERRKGDSLFIN